MILFFLLLFLIPPSLSEIEGVPQMYKLDDENPSFVLFGSDLRNGSIVLIDIGNSSDSLQVNALFEDLNKTDFVLKAYNGTKFSHQQLSDKGRKGLIFDGPLITLLIGKHSSNRFYISFTRNLYNDRFDIEMGIYNPKAANNFYELFTDENSLMFTVINKGYSRESCHEFEIQNLDVIGSGYHESCHLKIYIGAATSNFDFQVYYGFFGMLHHGKKYPPILSASYYTFEVESGCTLSFNLVERRPDPTLIDVTKAFIESDGDVWGSFHSCDFPGRRYSRKEPTKTMKQEFKVIGSNPSLIEVQGHKDSGDVRVEILRNGSSVMRKDLRYRLEKANETGDYLLLEWTSNQSSWKDGERGASGSIQFHPSSPTLFDVSRNPLVFDVLNWWEKEYEIRAEGKAIQVNVKIDSLPPINVTFSDQSQKFDIKDVNDQVFHNFVRMHKSANLDLERLFVAVFTSYDPTERKEMGLDDYQLSSWVKNRQSIKITKKRNTQAHTILISRRHAGCIGNITMSPNCSIPMYVSGIPSKAEANRMLLHTFTSDRTDKFVRTCLTVPSVTIIVPTGCSFETILTDDALDSSKEIRQVGAHGFVASREYPGNYDNYYPSIALTSRHTFIGNGLKIDPDVNFFVQIVSSSPSRNGHLDLISFPNWAEKHERLHLPMSVVNQSYNIVTKGFYVEWKSYEKNEGFLLNYEMKGLPDREILRKMTSFISNLLNWPSFLFVVFG